MAYNQSIADQIRELLVDYDDSITEKEMFGGYMFLYKGKMCIGVTGDRIVCRIVPEKYEQALELDAVAPMDFTGHVMKEFLYITLDNPISRKDLAPWVQHGINHARYKLGEPMEELDGF